MNIKSLLLGSAAALAVVSGAQAADAIVAAEPEPMEYVRVCDAFGTGYFYIPGTETCLKIGGEVRATVSFDESSAEDWDSNVRARLSFEAKNDSELGTVGSYIRLQAVQGAEADINDDLDSVEVEQAYITVGGFLVGRDLTWVDDWGLAGESDGFFGNAYFNTISYTYTSDAFTVGLGVDDLSDEFVGNEVGVQGTLSAAFGPASLAAYAVYDFGSEEGGIAGVLSADIGPGTLGIAAGWASGQSVGYDFASEWTVGAAYTFKATEKLSITPQVMYYDSVDFTAADAWAADIYVEYQLAQGLKASADLGYRDQDGVDDNWNGFVRLTRSF
ncbi:Porin subfamily protein [Rhizobium sp. RU33A]|uniref:porin n=1 Tax=Rhizobium sp. RU33A TaxID=1907413 RepID=UPI0009559208|nr:porin [Rhizobium sp. RU33A]SIQ50419.1 Porin subfamily protein [Rhizobium sp. RU33A]